MLGLREGDDPLLNWWWGRARLIVHSTMMVRQLALHKNIMFGIFGQIGCDCILAMDLCCISVSSYCYRNIVICSFAASANGYMFESSTSMSRMWEVSGNKKLSFVIVVGLNNHFTMGMLPICTIFLLILFSFFYENLQISKENALLILLYFLM